MRRSNFLPCRTKCRWWTKNKLTGRSQFSDRLKRRSWPKRGCRQLGEGRHGCRRDKRISVQISKQIWHCRRRDERRRQQVNVWQHDEDRQQQQTDRHQNDEKTSNVFGNTEFSFHQLHVTDVTNRLNSEIAFQFFIIILKMMKLIGRQKVNCHP